MENILIGLSSSIVASIILIYVLRFIKPRIEISKQIAVGKSADNAKEFQIKIVNKTRRAIIDIDAEMHLIRRINVGGGVIPEYKSIPLKINSRMEICGKKHKVNRDFFEGANFIFLTYQNIEELLTSIPNSYILITIGATDSFSGVRRIFPQEYFRKEDIVVGEFYKGNVLDIQKSSN